jgi:hypothetical protein
MQETLRVILPSDMPGISMVEVRGRHRLSMEDGLLKSGMSPVLLQALMSLMADGVFQATGRHPASFDDWARRNAGAFR